jgi:hypothetical protein
MYFWKAHESGLDVTAAEAGGAAEQGDAVVFFGFNDQGDEDIHALHGSCPPRVADTEDAEPEEVVASRFKLVLAKFMRGAA